MKKRHLYKMLCTAAVLAVTPLASGAQAGHYHDIVIDKHGNAVVDARGGCVRTKWHVGSDRCPGAEGARGAVSSESRTVYFGFNSSKLSSREKAKLDSLLASMPEGATLIKANLTGYTDPIGDSEYNRALSQRRAQAVKSYLIKNGYQSTVDVNLSALGEKDSQSNCDKDLSRDELIKCLSNDRRVEVDLYYED